LVDGEGDIIREGVVVWMLVLFVREDFEIVCGVEVFFGVC